MRKSIIPFILGILLLIGCSEETTEPSYNLEIPSDVSVTQLNVMNFQLEWVDESTEEEGYKIERKVDNNDWVNVTILPEDANSYIDTLDYRNEWNIVYFKIYSFKVDQQSPHAEVSSSIEFESPTALDLNLESGVILNWSDNSDGEEGFRIERRVGDEFNLIASVEENNNAYSDLNAIIGAYNFYRVNAFAGGNLTEYTNIDSIYVEE